ncbi:protein NLRC3-like [Scleropages formosus]|uniref:Protein NLRC3-like n=1 Tax=Scleropages formosus TaxID=113540 RepID=A0A0N8JWZ1_SCLFO|nr:protein NLRC3-like [Scleropages formosus]
MKYQNISEGCARRGKSVLLSSVYTKLCITESDSGKINDEHEVWQNQATSRAEASQETWISINKIFKQLPHQQKFIRTVLTKGIAGIGKTVSVQKFILNWVEGKANQDVSFIFLFSFRELSAITMKELSLMDLVCSFYPEIQYVKLEAYKVLFIFDGLDEYQCPLKFFSKRCASITDCEPLGVLLSNLIERNLLPSALLWITSRPAAANDIPPEFVDQVTEIRGFNDHQKEEYFKKKFRKKENLANRIIAHVKSSRSLHIMCHIPVFCWISAAVFEQMLTEDDEEIPSTLTQMYSRFLLIQINIKNKKYHVKPRALHGLHKCAVDKALEYEDGRFDLFLRFLLGMSLDTNQQLLKDLLPSVISSSESIKKTTQYIIKVLKKRALSPERCINLLHCLVELNDHSLLEEIQKSKDTGSTKLTETQCTALSYVLTMPGEVIDIFDLQRWKVSEEGLRRLAPVIKYSRKAWLENCHLTVKSCETVASILQSANSHLTELNLSHNDLGDLGLEKLCVGLKSPNCKLESLDLSFNKLNASGMKLLSDVLIGPHCKLQSLDLSNNDLEDSGVNVLCQALSNHQCKLKTLRLSDCRICEEGFSSLASALRSNPTYLEQLDLHNNRPGGPGVINALKDNIVFEPMLDPNTANKYLSITQKNRKVTRKRKREEYPNHSERFYRCNQVLCGEGLTAICYWEAEWSGTAVYIGMAYRGICRNGALDAMRLGDNDKSWSLFCSAERFSAHHNKTSSDIPIPQSRSCRVGVYLDWAAGTLSFYSVSSDTLTHLYTFHSTFSEPLYPAFRLLSPNTSCFLCHLK